MYIKVTQSLRETLATSSSKRVLSLAGLSRKPSLDAHWTGSHHVSSPEHLATLGNALIGQAYTGYSDPSGQASPKGKREEAAPQCLRVNSNFQKSSLELGGVVSGRSWKQVCSC